MADEENTRPDLFQLASAAARVAQSFLVGELAAEEGGIEVGPVTLHAAVNDAHFIYGLSHQPTEMSDSHRGHLILLLRKTADDLEQDFEGRTTPDHTKRYELQVDQHGDTIILEEDAGDESVCMGYPEHDWELFDESDGISTYHCKRSGCDAETTSEDDESK